MKQSPIHETVREHYAQRIIQSAACCNSDGCCDTNAALYPEQLLNAIPAEISNTSYGCGDPITLASLKPGQTVLDLGSGAGLDCILAAQKVGETGRVIGVDMTAEMIERARANASKVKLANIEFKHGYLENLPVEDNFADVIISNCVINLSPDKAQVFSEAFRVLKSGGKLAVSDIVTEGPLPAAVKESLSAWAGCVAGAVEAREYLAMLEAVGFKDISIQPIFFDPSIIDSALVEMNLTLEGVSPEMLYKAVYSAKITAYK
ncbi:MAG: arsenite methyltransferase [Anaerolineales bacterium]|nr:arsenite methyltransferase [Anaerolineales bacterium]